MEALTTLKGQGGVPRYLARVFETARWLGEDGWI